MNPNSKPLLVVDDEFSNRDLLSRRLRRAGYTVETAEDATQALDIIHSREVELVLLDTMMPGMTGVELLKLLRATHSPMELPVIMVTALSESQRVVEALSLGANDYVTKPVDFPVTLARIQAQLNHKWAEEELRQREERYSLASQAASDGLWDWDVASGQVYLSPRWKEMLGYDAIEIRDSLEEWLNRVHPEDRDRVRDELQGQAGADRPGEWACEYRILHRDGCYRWMASRAAVVCGIRRRAPRITGTQVDITRTKAFDPLTGLPNRIGLMERLSSALSRARAESAYRFALLFMDLDRFKLINDSLGHAAGDRLLVCISGRLEQVVREANVAYGGSGLAARLGGDEFVLLVENVGDAEVADELCRKVLDAIKAPHQIDGREVASTASIGVTLGDSACESAADMLRDADTAMYKAKNAGRARWELFDRALREATQARLEVELDLQRAVEREEFVVYYQPKVQLNTRQLTGFEALVRWQHPSRGLLAPGEFIKVAEETGHIHAIGHWVLREACQAVKRWRGQTGLPLTIAVNLSTKQLHKPDLAAQVEAVLAETGLEAGALRLEVTESVLIEQLSDALKTIQRLHELSVGLEIDDFGTGYASFGYLNTMPFDALKIDKTFVDRLAGNKPQGDIVLAMLSVAHSLGLGVTAEGVETSKQVDWLEAAGCETGQGYLFARPMPAEAVEEYIRQHAKG